ncbi:MAG: tetratricopeptide repeat protein [Okeania sp. SIO2C9]|nr:tetratricopeptide repeat protein [Okeania sp. SIO2C9]NEQ74296.1 tetratricopeptide repeat protein [Okeania sp. SIO2C9]
MLGKQSHWEEAIKLYQKIIKLNYNSADAYAQLGIALR